MKKLASSLFTVAILCGSCLLGSTAFAEDPYYIVEGPCLTLDEPWKLSQLQENIEKFTCKLPEFDSKKVIELNQGKTVKNQAGKAYYIEAFQSESYDYESVALLGVRGDQSTSTGQKQVVSFYMIHNDYSPAITMLAGGTSGQTSVSFEINNIYKGTYNDKSVKLIEVNNFNETEYYCRQYDFMNSKGKVDEKGMAKCEKTRFWSSLTRLAYVIADSGEVIGSAYINSNEMKKASEKDARSAVGKKVKSLNQVNNITLSNGIKCTKAASADKKAAPTFTCNR